MSLRIVAQPGCTRYLSTFRPRANCAAMVHAACVSAAKKAESCFKRASIQAMSSHERLAFTARRNRLNSWNSGGRTLRSRWGLAMKVRLYPQILKYAGQADTSCRSPSRADTNNRYNISVVPIRSHNQTMSVLPPPTRVR